MQGPLRGLPQTIHNLIETQGSSDNPRELEMQHTGRTSDGSTISEVGARKAPTDPQTSRKWFCAAYAVAEEACVACIVPHISMQWCLSKHSVTELHDPATGDVEERDLNLSSIDQSINH